MAFIYKSFMRVERLFLRFTARASRAITISHFKLNILHDSEPPHKKKNRKYCAICSHVMQYTVLNNGYLNIFNRKRQLRVSVVNRLFESFSKAHYLLSNKFYSIFNDSKRMFRVCYTCKTCTAKFRSTSPRLTLTAFRNAQNH